MFERREEEGRGERMGGVGGMDSREERRAMRRRAVKGVC